MVLGERPAGEERLTERWKRNLKDSESAGYDMKVVEYGGLYPAPQIPEELYLAEGPAKIAIPGTTYSSGIEPFRN